MPGYHRAGNIGHLVKVVGCTSSDLHDVDFGFTLTHSHHTAEPLLFRQASNEKLPDRKEKHYRQYPRQQIAQPRAINYASEFHLRLGQTIGLAGRRGW